MTFIVLIVSQTNESRTMTESIEAEKIAEEILKELHPWIKEWDYHYMQGRISYVASVVQRLIDAKDTEIKWFQRIVDLNNEKIEQQRQTIENQTSGAYAEIERLKEERSVNSDRVLALEVRLARIAERKEPANDLIAVQKTEIVRLKKQIAEATKEGEGE